MPPYHPDLAASARWLPRSGGHPLFAAIAKRLMPLTMSLAGSAAEEVPLDGCSVFVYRPSKASSETSAQAPTPASPRPALLWMHGGGLLFGDARQDEAFILRVVDELGIIVASAQYRFAPEHPFPTPLEDCDQALRWLAAQPEVSEVMVGGASAGGGLAAALCQLAQAREGVKPAFQLLVYPMLDDRSADQPQPNDRLFRLWDRRSNAHGWGSYLKGHARQSPPRFAVPGRTPELSGLPPAWIGVGTLDLFHDEDLDYARRLREAGVDVALEVVDGAYHGFDALQAAAPVSRAFRASQIEALRRAMGA